MAESGVLFDTALDAIANVALPRAMEDAVGLKWQTYKTFVKGAPGIPKIAYKATGIPRFAVRVDLPDVDNPSPFDDLPTGHNQTRKRLEFRQIAHYHTSDSYTITEEFMSEGSIIDDVEDKAETMADALVGGINDAILTADGTDYKLMGFTTAIQNPMPAYFGIPAASSYFTPIVDSTHCDVVSVIDRISANLTTIRARNGSGNFGVGDAFVLNKIHEELRGREMQADGNSDTESYSTGAASDYSKVRKCRIWADDAFGNDSPYALYLGSSEKWKMPYWTRTGNMVMTKKVTDKEQDSYVSTLHASIFLKLICVDMRTQCYFDTLTFAA